MDPRERLKLKNTLSVGSFSITFNWIVSEIRIIHSLGCFHRFQPQAYVEVLKTFPPRINHSSECELATMGSKV